VQDYSPQTKSFIILITLAIIGTYLCLALWSNLSTSPFVPSYRPINYKGPQGRNPLNQQTSVSQATPVDTSHWRTYSDKELKLSFSYDPTWKVLQATSKNGYRILQVDPGTKYYNIKIYVSPSSYYIMDGLPSTADNIGGQSAQNVNNALYGVKANREYYTFDVGLSMSLLPEVDALVHSVKFQN